MTKQIEIDGREITLTASRPGGAIIWCSNWDMIDEAARRGFVRSVCRGPAPFNHVDYYFSGE